MVTMCGTLKLRTVECDPFTGKLSGLMYITDNYFLMQRYVFIVSTLVFAVVALL